MPENPSVPPLTSAAAAFCQRTAGSTQCHACAEKSRSKASGSSGQSSKLDTFTFTMGKASQLRAANPAISALGSNAKMGTPRVANATVALPVPAPTSNPRPLRVLNPAKLSTSSTTASE
jgi:hypothetical protein